MTNSLVQKLGVKPGVRSIIIDAPAEAASAIGLPAQRQAAGLSGAYDYIHVFVMRQERLDSAFPVLKNHLHKGGVLWVSWPKGRALGTDLTLQRVIGIGYAHGLVESKTVSVDSTWSAIKFTFPKEGKHYNNSYGQLGKRSRH